jgi:hypothetical protein
MLTVVYQDIRASCKEAVAGIVIWAKLRIKQWQICQPTASSIEVNTFSKQLHVKLRSWQTKQLQAPCVKIMYATQI